MTRVDQDTFSGCRTLQDLYAVGFGTLKGVMRVAIDQKKPHGWIANEMNILLANWEEAHERLDRQLPRAATTIRNEPSA